MDDRKLNEQKNNNNNCVNRSSSHQYPYREQDGKSSNQSKKIIGFISLLIICALVGVGGGVIGGLVSRDKNIIVDHGNSSKVILSEQEVDTAKLAKKVSPSVVSILTEKQQRSYFGTSVGVAAGTGIIMSKDGYIITNKHVISSGSSFSVVASDGTAYDKVKVIGIDPLNDVAFLKIEGVNNLQPAEFGSSTNLQIGQRVMAIGNALGQYQNSVTVGIISGTNREVTASEDNSSSKAETLTDLIQTDAAINQGNSGGPLIDSAGRVIGINTAIAANAQNLGFAIPISATKGMMKTVLEKGEVQRGFLGVRYISITPDIKKKLDLPVSRGALLRENDSEPAVVADGPAQKAGLRNGDIITKINDIQVGEAGSVSSLISQYAPGEKIKITYMRDGQEKYSTTELGAYK